jgi:type II secretory pathway pseudopilin PulG
MIPQHADHRRHPPRQSMLLVALLFSIIGVLLIVAVIVGVGNADLSRDLEEATTLLAVAEASQEDLRTSLATSEEESQRLKDAAVKLQEASLDFQSRLNKTQDQLTVATSELGEIRPRLQGFENPWALPGASTDATPVALFPHDLPIAAASELTIEDGVTLEIGGASLTPDLLANVVREVAAKRGWWDNPVNDRSAVVIRLRMWAQPGFGATPVVFVVVTTRTYLPSADGTASIAVELAGEPLAIVLKNSEELREQISQISEILLAEAATLVDQHRAPSPASGPK